MMNGVINIAAVGDIMLDRDVGAHYFKTPSDFDMPEMAKLLGCCDLTIANLENPVGLRGSPHPKQDPHVAFRCHPQTLQALKNLGIHLVSLANNHMLDYGEETLLDTIQHLDEAQISHLGAGSNLDKANEPTLFTIKGQKIAVLASVMIYSASTEKAGKNTPGVADNKVGRIISSIKQLKKSGYLVLVTIHWGMEYCFYPIPYQRQQAKKMIDAGASIILGHGPHYPQGVEEYKHGQIVHSLGNFIFDEPYPYSKRSFVYMASLDVQGNVVNSRVVPVTLENHIPVIDQDRKFNKVSVIAENFSHIYNRKNKRFWKSINNRWFSDIVWRVTSMRSLKFISLPPISFYFDLGFKNLFKKLSPSNIRWLCSTLFRRLVGN